MIDRYLTLVGDADEPGALEFVFGLLDDGMPAERVLLDVIAPAQRRVGELWAANEWSVAREHAATAISEHVVAAVAARTLVRPTRGRIVVACVDGEYHALPARMLAEVLRLRGWRVDFLGASVPGPHLVSYLHQTGPELVALSCTLPIRLPRAHGLIVSCRTAGVPVLAGGPGFGPGGRFAEILGADGWAASAAEAADGLEAGRLPAPARTPPPEADVPEDYGLLVRRRPGLLGEVMDALADAYPPMAAYNERQREATAEDLNHILDFLTAALYLDDDALFAEFITWTCGILQARGVPAASVALGLQIMHDHLPGLPRARRMLAAGVEAARARTPGP